MVATSVPIGERLFERSIERRTVRTSPAAIGLCHGWPSSDWTATHGWRTRARNAAAVAFGFTIDRTKESPRAFTSASTSLQTTGNAAGFAAMKNEIGTVSTASAALSVTVPVPPAGTFDVRAIVTAISRVSSGARPKATGLTDRNGWSTAAETPTARRPPFFTVNRVTRLSAPAGPPTTTIGFGSEMRRSSVGEYPTTTRTAGDQGPAAPQTDSARTS